MNQDHYNELAQLSQEVYRKEVDVSVHTWTYGEFSIALKRLELEMQDMIANLRDQTGSPVFTNDLTRRIELEKRKQVDKPYLEQKRFVDKMRKDIDDEQAMLEARKRTFWMLYSLYSGAFPFMEPPTKKNGVL